MIIHSRLARHVSVLLGYFYPALASAKAAVQQDPAAFNQWMTYWVVMSVFAMVEVFVDFFVSWVPFYYEAKIVLVVWLAMPRYQGASQIYRRLLHPYLDKYEGDIDNGLEEMRAGATRRLHSLGASAASEIAKAVSRQGSSAKEVMLARVLGMAAGAAAVDDRPVRSAPPSPLPRRVYEACTPGEDEEEEEEEDEEEDEDESAASNASMLVDFTEVMKMGVFVQARSSFYAVDGSNTWYPRQIRLLSGTSCCMTESEDGPEEGSDSGAGGEQRFQVLAAEAAEDASGEPLLVLETDRGHVELSPPERDDRDSMLVGFELLLAASSGAACDGGGGGVDGFAKPLSFEGAVPSGRGDRRDRGVARRRSRRWEGIAESGGMELESTDGGSESDGRHHEHRR